VLAPKPIINLPLRSWEKGITTANWDIPAAWTLAPGMTLTDTFDACKVLMTMWATIYGNGGGANRCRTRFHIDGAYHGSGISAQVSVPNLERHSLNCFRLVELSAGSHTIECMMQQLNIDPRIDASQAFMLVEEKPL